MNNEIYTDNHIVEDAIKDAEEVVDEVFYDIAQKASFKRNVIFNYGREKFDKNHFISFYNY